MTLWHWFHRSSTPFRHETIRSNNQLCTGDSGQLVWISPILSVQQAWQPLVANTDHPWPPLVHWSLVLPSKTLQCLYRSPNLSVSKRRKLVLPQRSTARRALQMDESWCHCFVVDAPALRPATWWLGWTWLWRWNVDVMLNCDEHVVPGCSWCGFCAQGRWLPNGTSAYRVEFCPRSTCQDLRIFWNSRNRIEQI